MLTRRLARSEVKYLADPNRVDTENSLLSVYSVGIPLGHNIYHGYDFLFFANAENDPVSPDP